MTRQPQFDLGAATAALGYIATKFENVDLHKAFKLLYLAERAYLEQYGRPFSGDQYIAMDYGPVPSTTYDLAKAAKGDPPSFSATAEMLAELCRFIEVRGTFICVKEDPDLGELSRGAIRCLDDAIGKYGDSFAWPVSPWSGMAASLVRSCPLLRRQVPAVSTHHRNVGAAGVLSAVPEEA